MEWSSDPCHPVIKLPTQRLYQLNGKCDEMRKAGLRLASAKTSIPQGEKKEKVIETRSRGRLIQLKMILDEFRQSLTATEPPAGLTHALAGLWWDAKGDWKRAHESASRSAER